MKKSLLSLISAMSILAGCANAPTRSNTNYKNDVADVAGNFFSITDKDNDISFQSQKKWMHISANYHDFDKDHLTSLEFLTFSIKPLRMFKGETMLFVDANDGYLGRLSKGDRLKVNNVEVPFETAIKNNMYKQIIEDWYRQAAEHVRGGMLRF